jgi:hypothetical protein
MKKTSGRSGACLESNSTHGDLHVRPNALLTPRGQGNREVLACLGVQEQVATGRSERADVEYGSLVQDRRDGLIQDQRRLAGRL